MQTREKIRRLPTPKKIRPPLRKGVYLLPNLFTTGGLFCGFYASVTTLQGEFRVAATAILIALARPITRLLYERGQFTPEDVAMTSQALMAYGAGILAYGTSQVMVRLFNATKDTRTPAWIGVGSIGLHAAGCWLLMQVWGHWGIALVTSLVSYLNTGVLYVIFRRRHGPLDEGILLRSLGAHVLLATVLGGCLFFFSQPLAAAPGSPMAGDRLLRLAGILVAGGGVYLVLGLLLKVEEVRTGVRMLKRAVRGA